MLRRVGANKICLVSAALGIIAVAGCGATTTTAEDTSSMYQAKDTKASNKADHLNASGEQAKRDKSSSGTASGTEEAAPAEGRQPAAMKIPAPELRGIEEWINSKPLLLSDLKGKVVVLHFWTFG
jgi:hypothetical protein